MSRRFHLPLDMALSSTGASISGAKLNFYVTGTSTRLNTYSDNARTSANANPVVADSSGRFADIFLKPQAYKVVFTDADDVTLVTQDPVEGRASPFDYTGSATFNPSNLADGAGETTTVTVTGAALGDFAFAAFSLDLQGILLTAWVSAADTVSVRLQNETTGALNLAEGTLSAGVLVV